MYLGEGRAAVECDRPPTGGGGVCRRRCNRRGASVVAYVADHSALDGADGLFRQLADIQACAGRNAHAISRYVVDSGAPADGGPFGRGLLTLLDAARESGLTALVVADVGCLAADRSSAFLAAIAFAEAGVRVVEASWRRVGTGPSDRSAEGPRAHVERAPHGASLRLVDSAS